MSGQANTHWSAQFVGIPYAAKGATLKGCDCWGLVVLASRLVFFRDIPLMHDEYVSPDEAAEIHAAIERRKPIDWLHMERPAEGDVALFRTGRFERHVGLCAGGSKMLHMPFESRSNGVQANTSFAGVSRIEDVRSPRWAPRLVGFYRWQGPSNGGAT
jgi:cell wall-associated NlpC family hydrolase